MIRWFGLVCGVAAVVFAMPPPASWMSAQAAEAVDSLSLYDAKGFLDSYRTANAAQIPGFFDLYSDRAVVHARVQGQDKGFAFDGRMYKQLGKELLSSHRSVLDGSVFRDVTVEQRGKRLVIRGKRYSMTRCYWDRDYEMGLEKEGTTYRILEERLTINQAAHCDGATSALAPSNAGYGNAGNAPYAIQPPAPPAVGGYHPLSPDEIASQATRMAQEYALVARNAAQANSGGASGEPAAPPAVTPTTASTPSGPSMRQVRPDTSSSALWVTPE